MIAQSCSVDASFDEDNIYIHTHTEDALRVALMYNLWSKMLSVSEDAGFRSFSRKYFFGGDETKK